jgi:hypothetical protein
MKSICSALSCYGFSLRYYLVSNIFVSAINSVSLEKLQFAEFGKKSLRVEHACLT